MAVFGHHKPVIKESAETTKVIVVFDASVKEIYDAPSLNDLLGHSYKEQI